MFYQNFYQNFKPNKASVLFITTPDLYISLILNLLRFKFLLFYLRKIPLYFKSKLTTFLFYVFLFEKTSENKQTKLTTINYAQYPLTYVPTKRVFKLKNLVYILLNYFKLISWGRVDAPNIFFILKNTNIVREFVLNTEKWLL